MNTIELKTTSFRLNEDFFGDVFRYKPGPRFKDAWLRLSDGGKRWLPHASLRIALTVHSDDFVYLDLENGKWRAKDDDWFFFSRKKIGDVELRRVLKAWEFVVSEGLTGELAKGVDEFSVERVSIADKLGKRPGRCPSPEDKWIWKVAAWQVAHLLAQKKLRADGGGEKALRLDSEASLLTWDNLLHAGRKGQFAALHEIRPAFITIPGRELPVLHLQSSYVKLATSWERKIKHAWSDHGVGRLLLYAAVRARRNDATGEWEKHWDNRAPDVMRNCGLDVPPEPSTVDLLDFGKVRARIAEPVSLSLYQMGTGPGQVFHDLVAQHALRCLPGAENVEMVKACRTLSRRLDSPVDLKEINPAVKATGAKRYHLAILYGNDRTRLRLSKALEKLLGLPGGTLAFGVNDVATTIGLVSVVFVSRPGAEARLSGQSGQVDVVAWAIKEICESDRSAGSGVIRAAIIETGVPEELYGGKRDPKHKIRRGLAAKGVVTQFLSTHSFKDKKDKNHPAKQKKDEDHPADRAVWDLLRSAGVFPIPFPSIDGISPNTWLVGVHVVKRPKSGWNKGFVVSIVALKADEQKSIGFIDDGRGWRPLHEYTAKFLALEHNRDFANAKSLIDMAVEQLLARSPHAKAVLFLDASECRRFWNGLADTGGDILPDCASRDRLAIIRTRMEDDKVPRAARVGDFPRNGNLQPKPPGTTDALYRLKEKDYAGAMWYVSPSLTMSRQRVPRKHSRFTCDKKELKKNWQAMTMTEFLIVSPGPFEAESLYKLSAVLCRHAPTWIGALERPSPMHLARAIVKDHPDMHEARDAEGEPFESGE